MAREDDIVGNAKSEMDNQIAALKSEVDDLRKRLSIRTKRLAADAEDWLDDASAQADRATRDLRRRATEVSEVVRDNPGTISSAVILGGVVGLALGLLFAQASEPRRRWYER